MRLRMFVLIAVCVAVDVLVVRQVRQYDEHKATHSCGRLLKKDTKTIASHKKNKSGQADAAQEGECSTAAC